MKKYIWTTFVRAKNWSIGVALFIPISCSDHTTHRSAGKASDPVYIETKSKEMDSLPPSGSSIPDVASDEEGDELHAGHPSPDGIEIPWDHPIEKKATQDMLEQSGNHSGFSLSSTACSPSLFAGLSGTTLLDTVRQQRTSCINRMYQVKGDDAKNLFNEEKMIAIAAGFEQYAKSYRGSNSEGILQIVSYLRAGYFVQFYNKTDVGIYSPVLKAAMAKGFDAFYAYSGLLGTGSAHQEMFSEVITLLGSADLVVENFLRTIPILDAYRVDTSGAWFNASINSVLILYFRSQRNPAFIDLANKNQEIVSKLVNFIDRNKWLMGSVSYRYLYENAISELGRFLAYGEPSQSKVRPIIRDHIKSFDVKSPQKSIWVKAASAVYQHDKANCASYDSIVCDLVNYLRDTLLPVKHVCSDILTIRSQALTTNQNIATCNRLKKTQDAFFQKLKTDSSRPVPDDYSSNLEAVFFGSNNDYKAFAGAAYGIGTNNGGIFIEGSPETPGNQARFIGYQLASGELWNLDHEYVHYLDGRFNMPGGFSVYMRYPTVWWIEGVAEYISHGDDNKAANSLAQRGGVPLSLILSNNYNSGQDMVYRWGYLAVRYFFERRRGDLDGMWALLRTNQYALYAEQHKNIATKLDADFAEWLRGKDSITDIKPFFAEAEPEKIPVSGGGIGVSYYKIPGGIRIFWDQAPIGKRYSLALYNDRTMIHNGHSGRTQADITGLTGTETLRGNIRVYDSKITQIGSLPEFWIYPGGTPKFITVPGAGINMSYYRIDGGIRLFWEQSDASKDYNVLLYQGASIVLNTGVSQKWSDIRGLSGGELLRGYVRSYDKKGNFIAQMPDFRFSLP